VPSHRQHPVVMRGAVAAPGELIIRRARRRVLRTAPRTARSAGSLCCPLPAGKCTNGTFGNKGLPNVPFVTA